MTTLNDTLDAMVWAEEFCRIFNGKKVSWSDDEPDEADDIIDQGTMVTWFANAIERGRDAGRRELCPHPDFHVVSEEMKICLTCGLAVYGEEGRGQPTEDE